MVFIVIELVFDYCRPSLDTHDTDFSTVIYIPILQQSGLLRYPDGPYSDTLFTIQVVVFIVHVNQFYGHHSGQYSTSVSMWELFRRRSKAGKIKRISVVSN